MNISLNGAEAGRTPDCRQSEEEANGNKAELRETDAGYRYWTLDPATLEIDLPLETEKVLGTNNNFFFFFSLIQLE